MAKGKARRINPEQWRKIQDAQLAAVLRKVQSGRVLNSNEQRILDSHRSETPPAKQQARPEPASTDAGVWMTPAEFLRWLPSQGITLSRKNLYATYYGAGAKHPVHRSPDGKRIHGPKALELIRIIHGGDTIGETGRIIAERQAADARFRTAKARAAEIELEELEGKRVKIDVVERVWATMFEHAKNEARTLANNLPEDLHGKEKPEMRVILERGLRQLFQHLAESCRQRVTGHALKAAS